MIHQGKFLQFLNLNDQGILVGFPYWSPHFGVASADVAIIFPSIYIYIYVSRTQMTPIFEGRPPQNKAFSNQNRGHLGSRYIYFLKHHYLFTIHALHLEA